MRSEDFSEFQSLIEGLCAAFDRQCTDAKVKTFHEVLKPYHIADLKRSAGAWKHNFSKMPAPKDLIPQRAAAPAPKQEDGPPMSRWAVAASRILFALAYLDERRGFRPIGVWEKMPPGGWGLPLRLPKPIDISLLDRCIAIKNDYAHMGEQAELSGEPMDGQEFQAMCKEGFEKVLGIAA